MNVILKKDEFDQMEKTLCQLESLGTAVSVMCDGDHEVLDFSTVHDLGALISKEANEILDLLLDAKTKHDCKSREQVRVL